MNPGAEIVPNILEWNDKYSVGVVSIDEQHRRLFQIINDFNNEINKSGVSKLITFKHTASKVVEYVKYHFSWEEELMQKTDYPGYAKQKTEHNAFIKELLEDAARFDDRNPKSATRFLNFLVGWVQHHIVHLDRDLGQYLASIEKS